MVGTPLTHERYLRRSRGTYGEAAASGNIKKQRRLLDLHCVGAVDVALVPLLLRRLGPVD